MKPLSRRFLLTSSVFVFAASLWPLASKAKTSNSWDLLIDSIAELVNAGMSQDEVIIQLAIRLSELDLSDRFLQTTIAENTNDLKNEPDFTLAHFQRQFAIYVVGFQPGDSIPPHDHPGMSNATLCISGKVRIRSYEQQLTMDDTGDRSGQVTLQLVSDRIVNAHEVSTLTANKSNIHWLEAANECKLLDVFCPPYNTEIRKHVRYFDIEPKPVKGDSYRATIRPSITSAT